MDWKQQLANAFKELCYDDLPTAVELHEFNDHVLSKQRLDPATFCIDLAKFIFDNEAKLLVQMRAVKQRVHKVYNLLENLIPQLRIALLYPDLMAKAFGDYRHREDQVTSKNYMNYIINHRTRQKISLI